MYKGYNKIFWGIFIMTFNFRFGPIIILPAFVGLFIMTSGLSALYSESKLQSFNKTQKFGVLTAILSIIGGIIGLFMEGSSGTSILMSIWVVGYNIVEVILFFKIIESSVEYLGSNNYPELADEYTRKQRTYTIISIINVILINFALMYNISLLLGIVPIMGIFMRIYLMVMFNKLKKLSNIESITKEN